METKNVTRVELIDYNNPLEIGAREVVKYGVKDCELQLQDDGKTLKIFLNGNKS